MKKKKILVFGAAGFIGTYLIDELIRKNYQVIASDISSIGKKYYQQHHIPYLSVDITVQDEFKKLPASPFDAVIHLAAHQPANVSSSGYDSKDYIKVNVIGTLNILEFCRKNKTKKIIYASSHRNTQGLWKNRKVINEKDGRGLKFSGEYAMFSISESAAQDCVEHYRIQHHLNGIIFRLPPVYGYGPHTKIFKDGKPLKTGFQIFMEKASSCQPLEVWGNDNKGRDIIYIKDVIAAFIKAINSRNAHGLYNIASGKYLTLKEEAKTIAKVFWGNHHTQPKIILLPDKPNHIDSFFYDISKAKRELNWKPKYSFEDMLIDYKNEMKKKKFEFLIRKREMMLESD